MAILALASNPTFKPSVFSSRDPKKLDAFSSQGIDARPGDFSQPTGLAEAFHGIERLVIIPTTDLVPGVRARHSC